MELVSTRYTPIWVVKFSRLDLDTLAECANRHYDHLCQRQAREGGRIWLYRNMLDYVKNPLAGEVEVALSFEDVDLLGKIVENARGEFAENGTVLYTAFIRLLRSEKS